MNLQTNTGSVSKHSSDLKPNISLVTGCVSVCPLRSKGQDRMPCPRCLSRERPPQKSGGIFRPHSRSAKVGGVRKEKTWAGGVLEVEVVQVRARQAEGGASGSLLQSRLCLTGVGVHRTLGLLRLAQSSPHAGRVVPGEHEGSRGQWPGYGSLRPLQQI